MIDTDDLARHGHREADHSLDVTTFTHPDDVLHDSRLSVGRKRAILAEWASDAHAVPDLPALRQIDSGAIVKVDTVLAALCALDAPRQAGMLRRTASRSWIKPAFLTAWTG